MRSWKGGNTADCSNSSRPPLGYVVGRPSPSSCKFARRFPGLVWGLEVGGGTPWRGRLGKRKSCSVVVGLTGAKGLDLAIGVAVLVAIVIGPNSVGVKRMEAGAGKVPEGGFFPLSARRTGVGASRSTSRAAWGFLDFRPQTRGRKGNETIDKSGYDYLALLSAGEGNRVRQVFLR